MYFYIIKIYFNTFDLQINFTDESKQCYNFSLIAVEMDGLIYTTHIHTSAY